MLRKKLLSISLILGLCLTSIISFASENLVQSEIEPDKKIVKLDKKTTASFLESKQSNQPTISTYGPAPTLSFLEIVAVGSTLHQSKTGKFYEDISSLQFSTKENHGGSEFIVVTYELGFSSTQRAKFNGKNARLIDYDFIDVNGDNIIDGFMYYWDISRLSPSDYGEFTYEATSSNFPYNSMYDSLNIK